MCISVVLMVITHASDDSVVQYFPHPTIGGSCDLVETKRFANKKVVSREMLIHELRA
jgi:hypothetical protein